MIGFLIKKSFFDGWDNLITIVLMNLGFILCMAVVFFLPSLGESSLGGLTIFLIIPGILLVHVFAGVVSLPVREAADFQAFEFKYILEGFRKTWRVSLLLGAANSLIVVIVAIAFPFYLSFGNLLGIIGAGLIFWASIFWLLSSQYFFPVYTRMNCGFFAALKKCMLISLDNPGFSLFTLIYSTILLVLSVVSAFMIPGVSGILLFLQNSVKLRLYKYDWLEKNPESDRKKIPWDKLVYEDRERIGPRSLKGMIFPWKD